MARLPDSSARTRGTYRLRWLLVLLSVGVIVPPILFAGLLVSRLAADERSLEQRSFLDRASALADALDRELSASIRALLALAESERLERDDLESFHQEAKRLASAQPSWLGVRLLLPDGRVIADTRVPWGAPLGVAVEPDTLREIVESGVPRVGDLVADPDGRWRFAIRVPIHRDGRVAYVLAADVTAGELAGLVRSGSEDEWARSILDARGTVVARSRDPQRWVGRAATDAIRARIGQGRAVFRDAALEGMASYVAHVPVEQYGWSVVVLVPTDAVDARARRSLLVVMGLGVLVVLLSGGTAFWAARRLSRSIGATVAGAHALAAGARPRLRRSHVREVAELHAALERADALLEARSRERDEHLAHAERARADAERASRAKDEFLAMLGHELRNPLSPIVTALELLRMRGQGNTREHAIIDRQVRHVVRLVDDLLDVSRITRGALALKREVVELSSIVSRAIEMVRPLLESREHALEIDVPQRGLAVTGDPDRLAQVVANLLTNAARYTPPRGHVRVAAVSRGEEVAVTISDDGQGISAELLPHVFDLFVQGARSPDRREGGLGLGLSLVKSLVTAHGGRVEARSDGPGRGSTFTVTLPRAPAVPTPFPDRGNARVTPRPTRRVRVLVVDDNEDAAALLAELLESAGHEVVEAHDGPAALEALGRFEPDVAVLDVGLPVMDGYELAQRIQERLGERAPVLIALTGYGQSGDRERSAAAGFARHLVKPIEPEVLLATIVELAPPFRPSEAKRATS